MADNPNAEYGVLKIGGRIPSAREIGVLTGVSTRLVSNLIAELVENNVCSTMPDGALDSRRKKKKKEAFEGAADHGRAPLPHWPASIAFSAIRRARPSLSSSRLAMPRPADAPASGPTGFNTV